jgi:hypothetical protein
MILAFAVFDEKPRLRALLDHFAVIDDPCDPRRGAHPLPEISLLVVCDTTARPGVRRICRFCAANFPIITACRVGGGCTVD